MEDKLFDMLVKENEISWKDLIYNLIKEEGMDPWDINVTRLAQRYIDTVKRMKEFDFKVSGKVILAAAILLKIKSKRLIGEDMDEFDRLMKNSQEEMSEEEFYGELEGQYRDPSLIPEEEKMRLIPKTPQPRHRKVSIYDLVGALEKALEVKKRRILNRMPREEHYHPAKTKNIQLLIKETYNKILDFFRVTKVPKVRFKQLIEKDFTKEDKVFTFIPLLHLHNERKIDLNQEKPFGEIHIDLLGKKEVEAAKKAPKESGVVGS